MENINKIAQRYKNLAEVYMVEYQDYLKPSKKIMVAMGVIVEMMSDLALYHTKKPKNDKSKQQEERLQVLMTIINEFSVISDRNNQIRLIVSGYMDEIKSRDMQISKLEEELETLKQSISDYEAI